MSANAMASPSQQARSTHPQQAPASGGGKHRAAEDGHQFVFKPFKISKEATSAQRRAQRQDHVGATDPRKEEFGMLLSALLGSVAVLLEAGPLSPRQELPASPSVHPHFDTLLPG